MLSEVPLLSLKNPNSWINNDQHWISLHYHILFSYIINNVYDIINLSLSLSLDSVGMFYIVHTPSLSQTLQEDVAGVTLLALGNGMPDVMTACSSVNKDRLGCGSRELGNGDFA